MPTTETVLFNSEHRAEETWRYAARAMSLQRIKMIVSASWVALALAIAAATQLSWPVQLAIAALGVLPPLALLLWWNEPAQTMSESIDAARRGR